MAFLKLVRGFGILLLLQGPATSFARTIKFLKITTQHNPLYYGNVSSSAVNGTLNIDYVFLQETNYGMRGIFDIQYKMADSKRHQSLFAYDFDVCKLMNEMVKETLLRVWFQNIYKYSNLMQNCPIVPGHYYIRNMVFEPNSAPVYLRPGLYRIACTMYFGKRTKKFSKEQFRFKMTADLQIL